MTGAVITGVGVVCATGRNVEDYWESLSRGLCGIAPVSLFDTSEYRVKIAAQVRDDFILPGIRSGKRLSRSDMLGLTALEEALRRSRLNPDDIPPERIAVVMGSGSGGLLSAERFKRTVLTAKKTLPTLLYSFSSSSFTDLVAARMNSRGLRTTVSTACSSSSTALGAAMDLIRSGAADVVITGGTESLTETTFAGFSALRAVDERPCRPFDRERKGISLGEGAAIFVVEERESARKRGAHIFAEIAGYGISGDAHHVTTPEPGGSGISLAIEMALAGAGLDTRDIGYINAHGTGTPANDLAETRAIKAVFGERAYEIPVSSTKSMIGHCLGASGALEAAACILPFGRGILPPTANYCIKDPECDLNYVPSPVKSSVSAVLSLSLAFGGNNTALVLRSPS